ncbi:MAG: GNAT family N-acetyltransferase [Pseudomonadota bacterium]
MTFAQTISATVPLLETERLRFRAPSVDDYSAEVGFGASERSKGTGGPFAMDQVWRAQLSRIGQWVALGYGVWSLDEKSTGNYVGRVGIYHPADWPEAELAWTLMANGEGKGYAYEAALAARVWAYDSLGWTTLISVILPDNTRSLALAERLGCKADGTFEHVSFGTMNVWRHPGPEAL